MIWRHVLFAIKRLFMGKALHSQQKEIQEYLNQTSRVLRLGCQMVAQSALWYVQSV